MRGPSYRGFYTKSVNYTQKKVDMMMSILLNGRVDCHKVETGNDDRQ